MIDHPRFVEHNRPHVPSKAQLDFIYEVYQLLFRTPNVPLRTKQATLETAAVTLYPWRIVCISEKALRLIHEQRNTSGLRRGHPFRRADRASVLFQGSLPMSRRKFKDYYFKHDTVALVDAKENSKHGVTHWSDLAAVPEGLFTGGSFSVRLSPFDLDWVDQMCADNGWTTTTVRPPSPGKRRRRKKSDNPVDAAR